jgi:hypothetical protein
LALCEGRLAIALRGGEAVVMEIPQHEKKH